MIVMIKYGRHYGVPQTEYDTNYHFNVRNPSLGNLVGYNPSSPADILPFVKGNLMSALMVPMMISFSYLMWLNFWVSSIFCCILFTSITYYGAVRYYNMMTNDYITSLKKIAK